ncbi:11623_t:CDS:2 [Diversispora eburnea]|uniref:11623_t:CDS:1 n=1 Tax=Diversispora eburnea TaxID=1213867 RepID=A0A9N8ZMG7_9GLOM|nr:11623_t:CDS:2 [Diversispora eburnea]
MSREINKNYLKFDKKKGRNGIRDIPDSTTPMRASYEQQWLLDDGTPKHLDPLDLL